MKKKVIGSCIISLLIAVSIISSINLFNTKSSQKSEVSELEPNSEVYSLVETHADLSVIYDSYEDVMANSEIVVVGSVDKINSYMEDSKIVSVFDFNIDNVYKGNISAGTHISVWTLGGKVKFSDYIAPQKEYFEAKTSKADLEAEISLHGNEYVESILEGVPNVNCGDRLALCLKKSTIDNNYIIVGSSSQGQFNYDSNTSTVYKNILNIEKGIKGIPKKEMEISFDDFIKKAKNTKTLLKKKNYTNSATSKKETQVEIDHAYDKYKIN